MSSKKKGSIEERLIRSMKQAVEIARGTTPPARSYDLPLTTKDAKVPPAPDYVAAKIAAIRKRLGLSQTLFAQALNVSPGTVRSWEQGEKPPQGPSLRLLEIADHAPQALLGRIIIRGGQAKLTSAKHVVGGRLERRSERARRRVG